MSQLGSNRRKGSSLGPLKPNREAGSQGTGLREEAARPGQDSRSPGQGCGCSRRGRRGGQVCQGKCGDVCSFQGVSHSQSGKPVWKWLEDPGWRENGLHRLLLSGSVFKEKGAPGHQHGEVGKRSSLPAWAWPQAGGEQVAGQWQVSPVASRDASVHPGNRRNRLTETCHEGW